MTTQSMLTKAVNLFGSTNTSSAKSKSSENSDVSFGTIMSQNANAKRMHTSQSDVKTSLKKESVSTKYKNDDSSMDKTNRNAVLNQSQTTDSVSKSKSDVTAVKDTPDNLQVTKEEIPQEVIAEALSQMQSMIVSTVTDALGISEDELNSFMEELDLQPVDLLEPANVMQLMMKANGIEEPMQLLTDENMSNQLKELTSALDQLELPEEFGVTKDELITAMENIPKEMDFDRVMSGVTEDIQAMAENKVKAEPKILVEKSTSEETDLPTATIEADKVTQTTEKVTTTVTSEGSTGDQKESRDSKSQEQQSPVETFVQNLGVKGQSQNMTVEATAQRVETMRNIVEQVVEQIKVQIKPAATTMELQLNPENLGKINLSVASKDGQLTATITTQTEVAREALESQIQNLRDSLSNQGLKVEAVEVNVSSFGFANNQDNQMGNGEDQKKNQSNRRKIDLSEFDEFAGDVTEEEILAAKVMKQNGGNVDYSV